MKKMYFSKTMAVLLFATCILSCTNDNDERDLSTSDKNDLTLAEARQFVKEFTNADGASQEQIKARFSKKSSTVIDESEAVSAAVLNDYSLEQMGEIIPVYGGAQGIIPTYDMAGSQHRRNVEWIVAQNPHNLWRVKAFEIVTHSLTEIIQVLHQGTRFEGIHLGLINWVDNNSAGDILITPMGQFVSTVRGTIHIVGWRDTPIDNYCVFRIY
ncbi:hypothetical protein [Flavobacterium notoginsengisoli]|uniref:hypothetical protein n=1 Tax=Flavobacterium notoginsengisoli TaxID=1478199 RepID=UPI00362A24BE